MAAGRNHVKGLVRLCIFLLLKNINYDYQQIIIYLYLIVSSWGQNRQKPQNRPNSYNTFHFRDRPLTTGGGGLKIWAKFAPHF